MYTKREFISKLEEFIKQQKLTDDYDVCEYCPNSRSAGDYEMLADKIDIAKYTNCCLSFLVNVYTLFPSKFNKIIWMLNEKFQSSGNFPESEANVLLEYLKETEFYEVE